MGRLVTVPGSGQADRAPRVCACPGWALQPALPCPWPFVCALPHSPLIPLLPAAHLATWAGQRSQALVSVSHPGQRQAFLSKSGSGLRDFVGITGDRGVKTAVSPSAWPGAFVWLRDWVCGT